MLYLYISLISKPAALTWGYKRIIPQIAYQNQPHLNVARNRVAEIVPNKAANSATSEVYRIRQQQELSAHKRENSNALPLSSSENRVSVVRPRTSTVDVSSRKLVTDRGGSSPARSAETDSVLAARCEN